MWGRNKRARAVRDAIAEEGSLAEASVGDGAYSRAFVERVQAIDDDGIEITYDDGAVYALTVTEVRRPRGE